MVGVVSAGRARVILEITVFCRGATCYLNSLLQAMYMTPELRRGLYAIDPEELGLSVQEAQEASPAAETDESSAGLPSEAAKPKGKKAVRTLPLELQRLFAELQASDRAAVSTERLTTLGFGWSANEERVQHDVSVRSRASVASCMLPVVYIGDHRS
jgi:hypothetical protein